MMPSPWIYESPLIRSRIAAARSNSSRLEANSISVASSFCTAPDFPDRNALACATSKPYSSAETRPTHGAAQRLIWNRMQGRERFANTVSRQVRSRNTRCSAFTVSLTDQAEANGPQ